MEMPLSTSAASGAPTVSPLVAARTPLRSFPRPLENSDRIGIVNCSSAVSTPLSSRMCVFSSSALSCSATNFAQYFSMALTASDKAFSQSLLCFVVYAP